MPTLSVTIEEWEAFKFYEAEASGMVAASDDEAHLAEYVHHRKHFESFRAKFYKAKEKQETKAIVKNALAKAKKAGSK